MHLQLSISEEAPQERKKATSHQVLTKKRKRDQQENPNTQMTNAPQEDDEEYEGDEALEIPKVDLGRKYQ